MRYSKYLAALVCVALCLPNAYAAGSKSKKRAAPAVSAGRSTPDFMNSKEMTYFMFMLFSRMTGRLKEECATRYPEQRPALTEAYDASVFGKTSIKVDVRINDVPVVDMAKLDEWADDLIRNAAGEEHEYVELCAEYPTMLQKAVESLPPTTLLNIEELKK